MSKRFREDAIEASGVGEIVDDQVADAYTYLLDKFYGHIPSGSEVELQKVQRQLTATVKKKKNEQEGYKKNCIRLHKQHFQELHDREILIPRGRTVKPGTHIPRKWLSWVKLNKNEKRKATFDSSTRMLRLYPRKNENEEEKIELIKKACAVMEVPYQSICNADQEGDSAQVMVQHPDLSFLAEEVDSDPDSSILMMQEESLCSEDLEDLFNEETVSEEVLDIMTNYQICTILPAVPAVEDEAPTSPIDAVEQTDYTSFTFGDGHEEGGAEDEEEEESSLIGDDTLVDSSPVKTIDPKAKTEGTPYKSSVPADRTPTLDEVDQALEADATDFRNSHANTEYFELTPDSKSVKSSPEFGNEYRRKSLSQSGLEVLADAKIQTTPVKTKHATIGTSPGRWINRSEHEDLVQRMRMDCRKALEMKSKRHTQEMEKLEAKFRKMLLDEKEKAMLEKKKNEEELSCRLNKAEKDAAERIANVKQNAKELYVAQRERYQSKVERLEKESANSAMHHQQERSSTPPPSTGLRERLNSRQLSPMVCHAEVRFDFEEPVYNMKPKRGEMYVPPHIKRMSQGVTVQVMDTCIDQKKDLDMESFKEGLKIVMRPISSDEDVDYEGFLFELEDIRFPREVRAFSAQRIVKPNESILQSKLPKFKGGSHKNWLEERNEILRFTETVAREYRFSVREKDLAYREAYSRLLVYCLANKNLESTHVQKLLACESDKRIRRKEEEDKFTFWLKKTKESYLRSDSAVENAQRERIKGQVNAYVELLEQKVEDKEGQGNRHALLERFVQLYVERLNASREAERETVFKQETMFLQDFFLGLTPELTKEAEELDGMWSQHIPEDFPRLRSLCKYEEITSIYLGRPTMVNLVIVKPVSRRLANLQTYKLASFGGKTDEKSPSKSKPKQDQRKSNGSDTFPIDNEMFPAVGTNSGLASPTEATELVKLLPEIPVKMRWDLKTYRESSTYRLGRVNGRFNIKYRVPVTRKGVEVAGKILPAGTARHEKGKIGIGLCLISLFRPRDPKTAELSEGKWGCPLKYWDCPCSMIKIADDEMREKLGNMAAQLIGADVCEEIAGATWRKARNAYKGMITNDTEWLEKAVQSHPSCEDADLKNEEILKLRVIVPLELGHLERDEKELYGKVKGKSYPLVSDLIQLFQ